MNSKKQTLAYGALIAMAAALTGCSGGPSKGDLKDGLAAYFKEKPQQACWNIENSQAVQWPIRIPIAGMDKTQLGILDGVNRSGIATVTSAPVQEGDGVTVMALTITLTDKGKDAKAWDPKKGFCVGTREVQDVNEFTVPNKDTEGMTDVKFTWRYDDLPSWVDRDKFPKLPGMTAPVNDEAMMQKTNNGWRVQ
jgi:hypothetical protein